MNKHDWKQALRSVFEITVVIFVIYFASLYMGAGIGALR